MRIKLLNKTTSEISDPDYIWKLNMKRLEQHVIIILRLCCMWRDLCL